LYTIPPHGLVEITFDAKNDEFESVEFKVRFDLYSISVNFFFPGVIYVDGMLIYSDVHRAQQYCFGLLDLIRYSQNPGDLSTQVVETFTYFLFLIQNLVAGVSKSVGQMDKGSAAQFQFQF